MSAPLEQRIEELRQLRSQNAEQHREVAAMLRRNEDRDWGLVADAKAKLAAHIDSLRDEEAKAAALREELRFDNTMGHREMLDHLQASARAGRETAERELGGLR